MNLDKNQSSSHEEIAQLEIEIAYIDQLCKHFDPQYKTTIVSEIEQWMEFVTYHLRIVYENISLSESVLELEGLNKDMTYFHDKYTKLSKLLFIYR
jgi:hypothetical protein